jgi:hypothetical protein
VWAYTRPRVDVLHHDAVTIGLAVARLVGSPRRPHDDASPARHRVTGVDDKVDHDLLELARLGHGLCETWRQIEFQRHGHIDPPEQHPLERPKGCVDVHQHGLRGLTPAECQQLLGQLLRPIGCVSDLLELVLDQLGRCSVCVQVHLDELHRRLNHHQQVVEVVRDAASQTPDGLQLLGVAELLFEPSRPRHVHGDGLNSGPASVFDPRRPHLVPPGLAVVKGSVSKVARHIDAGFPKSYPLGDHVQVLGVYGPSQQVVGTLAERGPDALLCVVAVDDDTALNDDHPERRGIDEGLVALGGLLELAHVSDDAHPTPVPPRATDGLDPQLTAIPITRPDVAVVFAGKPVCGRARALVDHLGQVSPGHVPHADPLDKRRVGLAQNGFRGQLEAAFGVALCHSPVPPATLKTAISVYSCRP